MSERLDVYDRTTAAIVAQLEAGAPPWSNPVKGAPLQQPIRHNGEPYSGVNVLMLWMSGAARGYSQRRWMTFKQALALGAAVRKGEKGSPVVYAGAVEKTGEVDGETVTAKIPFLKSYTVFNVQQIDGLTADYIESFDTSAAPDPIPAAEAFFARVGAEVTEGGQPCYVPALDQIRMPPIAQLTDAEAYYAVLAHEHIHWTGAAKRLDRKLSAGRFGSATYAFEELVAELGAAFACASLGLSATPRDDHAAYLASWLEVLKNDSRAIFTAAALAQKACDYLHGQAARETEA